MRFYCVLNVEKDGLVKRLLRGLRKNVLNAYIFTTFSTT